MQTYSSIASREQVKKQNWEGFGKYAAVVYFEVLCWNWRVWGEPRTLSDRVCSLWAPDFSNTKQGATHSTDVKFCVDISNTVTSAPPLPYLFVLRVSSSSVSLRHDWQKLNTEWEDRLNCRISSAAMCDSSDVLRTNNWRE